MLDPATAPLAELDRELARLVRRFGVASHVVANGTRPEGIDDDTFAWWVAAHRAHWARRMEHADPPPTSQPAPVPRRQEQLPKPTR